MSTNKEIPLGADGNPLSEAEVEFNKKYVDFTKVKFPEVNKLDFVVPDYKTSGKMIKISDYRFPAQTPERKGIVQMVHGYGDYFGRWAYFAEKFAQ